MLTGFEVDVERAAHVERLVRSDLVEELSVALDLEAELVAVVDLEPVEVLVLERAEGALADAVLVRALAAGADVDQLRSPLDAGGEADRLEAGAVIGDERDRADLAGQRVDERLGERPAEQPLALGDRLLDCSIASRWFWVVETCQPSSSFDQ